MHVCTPRHLETLLKQVKLRTSFKEPSTLTKVAKKVALWSTHCFIFVCVSKLHTRSLVMRLSYLLNFNNLLQLCRWLLRFPTYLYKQLSMLLSLIQWLDSTALHGKYFGVSTQCSLPFSISKTLGCCLCPSPQTITLLPFWPLLSTSHSISLLAF